MNKTDHSKAFTLIEICIVIIILGFLVAGAAAALNQYYKHVRIKTTVDNIATVESSLHDFFANYGFYPCPASPAAKAGDSDFSASLNCTLAADLAKLSTANNAAGLGVVSGVIPSQARVQDPTDPTKTIIVTVVPYAKTMDGWGRRLTYAVTKDMTAKATYDKDKPAVTVNMLDNTGPDAVTEQPFLIFSAGPDGKGAFNGNGINAIPCDAIGKDAENCDGNAVFAFTEEQRSTTGDNNNFDDFLSIRTTKGASYRCTDPRTAMVGIKDGLPICEIVPQYVCADKGLAYRPTDPSKDADGCAYMQGALVGNCPQGNASVDLASHPSISGLQAPAYWDPALAPGSPVTPWGPSRRGCSCPPGFQLEHKGMCNWGDCILASVTGEVYYYGCRKL